MRKSKHLVTALDEFENDQMELSVYYKALSKAKGDNELTKKEYLSLRSQHLEDTELLRRTEKAKDTAKLFLEVTSTPAEIRIFDLQFYEEIAVELEEERYARSIWAEALIDEDGNEDLAYYRYIVLRAEQLKKVKLDKIKKARASKATSMKQQKMVEREQREIELKKNSPSLLEVLVTSILSITVIAFGVLVAVANL